MRHATRTWLILFFWLAASSMTNADVVTDWNEKSVIAATTATIPHAGAFASRNMAMVHLAMFEALNTIEPRYTPYRARLSEEPGASREAAASAAAHGTLVRLYPAQKDSIDKALAAALAGVAEGPSKASGIRLGEQAAAAILADRGNDGSTAPDTYRPFTMAGKYVPTPPTIAPMWPAMKPFALKSGDQFRPPAPYALSSAQYAKDYNEVKAMGAKIGSSRTPEQTDIARFWALTGPATYNPVARQVSTAKGLDVLDNARLFALFAMATADAIISVYDAKYAHGFWRPVTAIRNADMDGNDGTERDAAWEPLIATPMHPEYPCAHCISQGSAASVLRNLYGDAPAKFSMTSTTAPGVTRSFERLSDYVNEVINARIYDGVHYRTSGDVGAAMGQKIGDYVVQNYLKPVR